MIWIHTLSDEEMCHWVYILLCLNWNVKMCTYLTWDSLGAEVELRLYKPELAVRGHWEELTPHLWGPKHLFSWPVPELSAVLAFRASQSGEVQMAAQWWPYPSFSTWISSPQLLEQVLAVLKEGLNKQSTAVRDTGVLAVTFSSCILSVTSALQGSSLPALHSPVPRQQRWAVHSGLSAEQHILWYTSDWQFPFKIPPSCMGKDIENLQVREYFNLIS